MTWMTLKTRLRWTGSFSLKVLLEALKDIFGYYFSPYPLMILLGAIRRWRQRMIRIWLPKSKGRPPVSEEIIDLVLEMKRENPGWGGQRISDELAIIGIRLSKKKVLDILKHNGFGRPPTKFVPPKWGVLWDCYRRIWGIDFTTVFDVKGNQLFIFNILDWCSRRLILSVVTAKPNSHWLYQQLCNAAIEVGGCFADAIVRDNDKIYGYWLDHVLAKDFGAVPVAIQRGSPWQNGRTERLHYSLKWEALERLPIANLDHCRQLVTLYRCHYNLFRPHQALKGSVPEGYSQSSSKSLQNWCERVRKRKAVGGLITEFYLEAA